MKDRSEEIELQHSGEITMIIEILTNIFNARLYKSHLFNLKKALYLVKTGTTQEK